MTTPIPLDPGQSHLCHQCKVGECVEVFVAAPAGSFELFFDIVHPSEEDSPYIGKNKIVNHPFGPVGGVVSISHQPYTELVPGYPRPIYKEFKLTSEPTVTERDGRWGWVGILERLEG